MGWLQDLKEGDTVIVRTRYSESIRKVDKITPTGKIRVGNFLFTDGRCKSGNVWDYTTLEEPTEEKVREITEKYVIRKALTEMHETKDISYEQAKAILEILKT